MFRNPRENANRATPQRVAPSTGRPPTPPGQTSSIAPAERNSAPTHTVTSPYFSSQKPSMAGSYSTVKKGTTPVKPPPNGRQSSSTGKQNSSILNFFSKSDGPPKTTSRQPRITQFATKIERARPSLKREESSNTNSLFLEDKNGALVKLNGGSKTPEARNEERERSKTPDDIWGLNESGLGNLDEHRFNENGSAVKKRKVESPGPLSDYAQGPKSEGTSRRQSTNAETRQRSGPFIVESDSEDELHAYEKNAIVAESKVKREASEEEQNQAANEDTADDRPFEPPLLVREATSRAEEDAFAKFDDMEDEGLQEDDFIDRPWEADEGPSLEEPDFMDAYDSTNDALGGVDCERNPDADAALCPICQSSLGGLSETAISIHVNGCLDGGPSVASPVKAESPTKGLTRSERAAVARPAQRDPYAVKSGGTSSAFSKLMAGNAEDNAWSVAAANEVASRGKQAYQRTCPFYKIIPGFSICVDAFRYGAVEGCNAYFLSHFHSDHYIGLTSSWRHGPIYCSKVTGNLVRQQLRVDPKWVVDLEFEKKVEVPNTGGVQVTMLHANHCPGSSLFLFENQIGQGSSSRLQRVLHCGDFRACPAHVQHPLLRPHATDPVTGKTFQQKIDVCYLDTTYLSPKYAFPSQEDVISACAEMCVSLNNDDGDGQLLSDIGKANGSSSLMSKFVTAITGTNDARNKPSAARGRLLVVIGTYSIGKERVCLGIARALGCKIYATPQKQRVCACLEDAELSSLLTDDPLEAQIHMQTLFEIRAETLADYLDSMKPHFTRVVGFRPTGWTYRPPAGRMLDNPPVSTVLHSENWKTAFSARDMVPQRGSTRESACFGVPYSEHSSFRELTMFCCALRIGRVIPTVNVGSRPSRERMKAWVERWDAEKRKSGLFRVEGNTW